MDFCGRGGRGLVERAISRPMDAEEFNMGNRN